MNQGIVAWLFIHTFLQYLSISTYISIYLLSIYLTIYLLIPKLRENGKKNYVASNIEPIFGIFHPVATTAVFITFNVKIMNLNLN